jgi:hypothetical protein
MAVRPAQLGLRSPGGSVRDPPASPAVAVRGPFQLRSGQPGLEPAGWGVWAVRFLYGSDPKSTAIAAARWLRAEPGHQGRSWVLWHPGRCLTAEATARTGRAGPGHGAGRPRPARRLPAGALQGRAGGAGLPPSGGGTQAGRRALALCWRRRAPRPELAFTSDGRIRAPACPKHPA